MSISDALRAKIRGLAAKTVANGCTEAEAVAAAELLEALLDKHGVTLEDVRSHERGDGGPPDFEFCGPDPSKEISRHIWCVTWDIAQFFDVGVVSTSTRRRLNLLDDRPILFFGFRADAAAATALTEIVAAAMASQWQAYRAALKARGENFQHAGDAKIAKRSFQVGLGVRVAQRLREMRGLRNKARGALVVAKRDLIVRFAGQQGVEFATPSQYSDDVKWDERAFSVGVAAGDRVQLGAKDRFARNPGNETPDATDPAAAAANAEEARRREAEAAARKREREALWLERSARQVAARKERERQREMSVAVAADALQRDLAAAHRRAERVAFLGVSALVLIAAVWSWLT